MKIGNLELGHLKGFNDKAFGLYKEFVGTVIGNDKLQDEGEAQQAQASESLKALRKEAEAQAHEAKARVQEKRQRTAQRAS